MNKTKAFFPIVFQVLVRPTFFLLLKIFCRVEIHGRENLSSVKKAIFAPNHVGELDAVIVGSCIPFRYWNFLPMFFTSLPGEYYKDKEKFGWRSYFYKEWFFKMLGAYPIKKNVKNYSESLDRHIKILNRGYSVLIFPEGKMSEDGKAGIVHGGVAFVSDVTDTPIIPVYIKGHFRMKFSDLLFRRRKLKVHYGRPVKIKPLLSKRLDVGEDKRYREAVKELLYDFRVESTA